MAETKLVLTWAQFKEVQDLINAIDHAKRAGADEGELKNTIADGEWTSETVEITLDI